MAGGIRDEEGRVRPGVHIPKTAMDEIKRLKESNAEILWALNMILEAVETINCLPEEAEGLLHSARLTIAKAKGKQ